jgi:hypothetical protein
MSVLSGDSNGDRVVNSGDALQTRSRAGQVASVSNVRSELNLDGNINSGDTIFVRARSGTFISGAADAQIAPALDDAAGGEK